LRTLLAFVFSKLQKSATRQCTRAPKVWKKYPGKKRVLPAVGTEPFWYVKIEPDSGIIYNQMDEGITRYPYSLPKKEGDKTIFESSLSGSKIKITIYAEQCSDGMSDECTVTNALV
jgi:uncharacterized membrane protein